ncbi:MAG: tyrosine-type recombinase/integrase [Thermoplasmata archaeon]
MRINELRKITLDDIHDDVLRVTGKGQKTRDVYLPESIRRGTLPEYLRVRRTKPGVNALFTNMYGEPLTYDGLRVDVYQLSKRAGVHFSPHMARRFYARFLYQQGYDLEVIRLILGHEKLDTTKRYMQVDQKDALEVFRKKQPDFFLAEVKLL